jgi:hypothetical protein
MKTEQVRQNIYNNFKTSQILDQNYNLEFIDHFLVSIIGILN